MTDGQATHVLFPGMFVKTGFVVGEKSELTVPESAVVQRSEVTGVYVVGETATVSISARSVWASALPDADVVLAGLTEGERVALDPIAAGVLLKSQPQRAMSAPRSDGHD